MSSLSDQFSSLLSNFSSLPKYRNLNVRSEDDISNIPLSGKQDIINFDMKACPKKPAIVFSTTGTTRKPAFVYCSEEAVDVMQKRMEEYFTKLKIGDNDILLNMFSYGGLFNAGLTVGQGAFMVKSTMLPVGLESNPALLRRIIKEVNPTVLFSYPNQLYKIFSIIGKNHKIKKCIAGGELILDEHRNFIESFGKTTLHSSYGCAEVGPISVQIESSERKELLLNGLYCEVLKEDGTAEGEGEGKLLLTDLNNLSMPIIRYDVGDWVKIEKRGNERHITVYGRTGDIINIHGNLVSKRNMVKEIFRLTKNPDFFVSIRKKTKTYDDDVQVNLLRKDISKKEEIMHILNGMGVFPRVAVSKLKVPRSASGKLYHIIDFRKKQLKDNNLSF